jgi:hypothetical protein
MRTSFRTVRPELVEGLFFLLTAEEGKGFDKLSPNGCSGGMNGFLSAHLVPIC